MSRIYFIVFEIYLYKVREVTIDDFVVVSMYRSHNCFCDVQ